jgi:hypothetical protein
MKFGEYDVPVEDNQFNHVSYCNSMSTTAHPATAKVDIKQVRLINIVY